MKLHCAVDGGCVPNPGHGAVAYCLKDSLCAVLEKGGKELEGLCTNNQAEFEAVIWALETIVARYPDCQELHIYSDSQLVVNILNGEWTINRGGYATSAGEALAMVIRLETECKTVSVHWIPRERNNEAGEIAEKLARESQNKKPEGWMF